MADFNEFDATKFVAGTLFGVRNFNWWPNKKHSKGPYLYSPSYDYQWESGENEADCRCWSADHSYSPAAKDHQCGFYAYTDNDRMMFHEKNAVGVIEAWGTITVGTRGFRAAKAKIVALAIKDWTLNDWFMLEKNYPDIELFDDKDSILEKYPLSKPPEKPPPPPPPNLDVVAKSFRNNQCPHCKGQLLFAPATSEFYCQPCNKKWPGAFVINAIHAGYRR